MEVWIIGIWAMAWIVTQLWNPPDQTRQFLLILFLVLIFIAMFVPYFAPALVRTR
jgi:hypothetical protein